MAATVASLGRAHTTTAGNKTVTATPTAGDLIVIIAVTSGLAGGTTAVSDNNSDGLGTYTQVDVDRTGFSTTGVLTAWVRNNLIGSATSTVFTASQGSSTGGGLQVLRVTGMSLTGSSAVRSSGGESSGTSATTPAPVLSLTPLSSNPIITSVANGTNGSTTVVQRAGYTEDGDSGYATPATGFEVAHLASGETSATLTHGGTSASAFASIAIELQYNTVPTVVLNSPADASSASDTTPTLDFTGTDADGDSIEYRVQVDTVNTFDSVVIQQDSQTSGTTSNAVKGGTAGSGQTAQAQGQSFTATSSFNLGKAVLLFSENSDGATDNLYLEIRSGSITGTLLGTSNNVSVTGLNGSQSFEFNFSTVIPITGGVKYYMIVQRTGAFDLNVWWGWNGSTGSVYSGGGAYTRTNNVWGSESATDDYRFILYSRDPLLDKTSDSPIKGTNLTKGSASASNPFTTASITPGSNKLILLFLNLGGSGDIAATSITGCGLTWVLVDSKFWSSGVDNNKLLVYRAMGASPTTGAITINFATNRTGSWSVDQFSSVDTSGTNGSGAIVQSVTGANNDDGSSSLTINLSAFGDTANAAYGAFGDWNGNTLTPEDGWSSLSQQAGGDGAGATNYKPTSDTTVVGNFGSADNIAGIAIEIKADSGFVNPDTGGDLHPFNSGENIQYIVKDEEALSPTTYYWRVSAKDPLGLNTYGAWSSTRSFTVTAGGGATFIYPIQRRSMGMGA